MVLGHDAGTAPELQQRAAAGATEVPQPAAGDFAPYPLFIHLAGQRVAVIGGGAVAERKVRTLLAHGAHVTVTAPQAIVGIVALARAGRIAWNARPYRVGDLSGALLAISATDDRAVNEAVYQEAQVRTILVNVVDVPDLCTAIVPSIMQRGRLQIAVSTQGAAPSVARDIRRGLEQEFPVWWEPYLDLMAEVRVLIKQRVPGPASVRTPLYEAVAASDMRERIAAGERPTAAQVYDRIVAPLRKEEAR